MYLLKNGWYSTGWHNVRKKYVWKSKPTRTAFSPLKVSYLYRMIMTITFYRKYEYSLLSLLNHNDNNALKFKCQMLTLQILSSLCDLKWLFRCHRQTISFKISHSISSELRIWFPRMMNVMCRMIPRLTFNV